MTARLDKACRLLRERSFDDAFAAAAALVGGEEACPPTDVATRAAALQVMARAALAQGELRAAQRAAQAVLDLPPEARSPEIELDLLALLVSTHGQCARYDEALAALNQLTLRGRRAGQPDWITRARGTAGNFFAALGDPWAALRVFDEMVRGLPEDDAAFAGMRAAAHANAIGVLVQRARMARDGGCDADAAAALALANETLVRARCAAARAGDENVASLIDLNHAEIALMADDADTARPLLVAAAERADTMRWRAQGRRLHLLLAKCALLADDPSDALAHLAHSGHRLGDGHELELRIRHHALMHEARARTDDDAAARDELAASQRLAEGRNYLRQRAQSLHLRVRLEVEHLYTLPRSVATRRAPPPTAAPLPAPAERAASA